MAESLTVQVAKLGTRMDIVEGMAKAYRNGATLKQVGVLFGCSSTSVGSQLKKAGILLRPSNSVSRKI
jgi:hypothetical protein